MKKKYCDGVTEKHQWEVMYEYETQYCYCVGDCTCGPPTTHVIAKCTKCDAVMDISDIERELNRK